MNEFYLPFLTALIISYIVTPLVKWIANRVGAIDVPKDERRVHKVPIPRLGGLAIYISTIASMLIFVDNIDKSIIGIIAGATIIVITGIIDDIKPLSAKTKFMAQILAAVVLILADVKIDFISNPFDKVDGLTHLGMFSIPITIFWIIGITNTLNFIDGLDGLAAGVASISAMSLLFVATINGVIGVAIIAAILAGAAFGFLPHNFNPAKIFMGDTGSLFLGFMLSVLAMKGVMKSVAAIGIAVPVLVIGIPIFDTTFAILRRLATKTPPWQADKGHLHHRLLDRGLTQKQTVLVLYTVSVFLGLSAVAITNTDLANGAVILGIITTLAVVSTVRMSLADMRRSKIKQDEK